MLDLVQRDCNAGIILPQRYMCWCQSVKGASNFYSHFNSNDLFMTIECTALCNERGTKYFQDTDLTRIYLVLYSV